MFVVYEVVIMIMILIEFNYFKTYFSPFSIMGCCYAIAPILINIIGKNIGMYTIKDYNLLYTMIFLIIFWIPGIILSQCTKKKRLYNNNRIRYICSRVDVYRLKLLTLFIVCILFFLITVITVLRTYGFAGSKNHTDGVAAHFGYLALMLAPYIVYYAVNQKKYLYFVLIGLLFFELIMLQNKLPIVILLLQSIYFIFMMKGRARGKKIIKIGLIVVLIVMLLFIGLYSIQPWLILKNASMQDSLNYGFERFIHYFFSGFISSNEYYMDPAGNTFQDGWKVAFGFINTLKEFIFGKGDYVSRKMGSNSTWKCHECRGNVFGISLSNWFFVGWSLCFGNWVYGIFYILFICQISNFSKYFCVFNGYDISKLFL